MPVPSGKYGRFEYGGLPVKLLCITQRRKVFDGPILPVDVPFGSYAIPSGAVKPNLNQPS